MTVSSVPTLFPGPSARGVRRAVPDPAPHPAGGPLPVLGRDVRVPLAGGGEVEYAALDYAASAPALQRVWEEVAAYAPYYGSVHRGAGHLSRLSTDLYERSRAEVAGFLGCRPDDEVVFTRSTTDSINLLAAAVPVGTRVVVFETEHHAALLPWRTRADCPLTVLAAPRTPQAAVAAVHGALAGGPGGPALVCATGASNVTGEIWPVPELAAAAHAHGARFALDAAQLVPHRPVRAAAWGADYVAFSGHKLYAPFGAGVLAGRRDWLDAAEPRLAGGGASRCVGRDPDGRVTVDWHRGPARHEAGSPNVIGALAIAAACRALRAAGPEALVERERALVRRALDGLAAVDGVRVLSLFGGRAERVAVVSFTVAGWDGARLAAALSAEHGIGVRDGLFCAHPLLRTLLGDPAAGRRPAAGGPAAPAAGPRGAVRMSFGAGTPDEHVDRFLAALARLSGAGRPRTTARRRGADPAPAGRAGRAGDGWPEPVRGGTGRISPPGRWRRRLPGRAGSRCGTPRACR